ncbi:MAG TPA: hypothetical protein VFV62_01065, partial [Gaiellaceae bacterium]|nr:hypothetical protein [Gaiellaceae bacterium]
AAGKTLPEAALDKQRRRPEQEDAQVHARERVLVPERSEVTGTSFLRREQNPRNVPADESIAGACVPRE